MDGVDDEVSEIHVSNGQFIRTTHRARIKTWQGGSGFARDYLFSFQQLTVTVIDQYYCNGGHSCSNKTSAVCGESEQCGVRKEEVRISLACTLGNVQLSSANGKQLTSYTLNAHGKTTPAVVPSVPLLS